MRAVECPAGDGDHVHAENDDKLARAVLGHTQLAHPELGFDERAAEKLVSDASYEDVQHAASKKSWAEFTGKTTTGTHLT